MTASHACNILGLESGAERLEIIDSYIRLRESLNPSAFFGTPLFALAMQRLHNAEKAFFELMGIDPVSAGLFPEEQGLLEGYFSNGGYTVMNYNGGPHNPYGPGNPYDPNNPYNQQPPNMNQGNTTTCQKCGGCCECLACCECLTCCGDL